LKLDGLKMKKPIDDEPMSFATINIFESIP